MTDNEASSAREGTTSNPPTLTAPVIMISLLLIATIIGFYAEFLVRSIGSFTVKAHIPDGFVGLILIFIIRNATEHMTAVTGAFRGKVDFVIGITLGSSV